LACLLVVSVLCFLLRHWTGWVVLTLWLKLLWTILTIIV
jgi:hypothetical protein